MPSSGPSKHAPRFRETPRQRVIRSIQEWIRDGVLPLGERIPAERVIAERLDVSRVTVRSALGQLENEGLISPAKGGARLVASLGSKSTTTLSNSIVIVGETIRLGDLTAFGASSGWHLSIQIGAMEAVQDSGRSVVVLHPDRLLEANSISRLAREGPLGVIFISRTPQNGTHMQAAEALVGEGVPVAVYGYEEEFPGLDTVSADQEAGAYELARWLVGQGRKRILCVAPALGADETELPAWYRRRYNGYARAMHEAGLETLPAISEPKEISLMVGRNDDGTWARVLAGYLVEQFVGANPPDAVMAASDGPASTVAATLRLFGKTPGRDVLVTGYDNYWKGLPEQTPPAATVDKRNGEIGRALVGLVLERAAGKLPVGQPEHRLVAPRLVPLEAVTGSK